MTALSEKFCWYDPAANQNPDATDAQKYQRLVDWASRARGVNPAIFDELTAFLLGAGEWDDAMLEDGRELFMNGILKRFLNQNRLLREQLAALEPSGLVNPAVYGALDHFDDELNGRTHTEELKEAVERVFRDFSALKDLRVRQYFSGGTTGSAGTDSVDIFGYVNVLKDCDASVQWTLFMPDFAKQQQNGFRVDSFEYVRLPAFRFIGTEYDISEDADAMKRLVDALDAMKEYRSGFDYDILLMHHFGKGVDVECWHGFFGRFMAAGAPVPDGLVSFDFVPQDNKVSGPPYISQFALAKFSGDMERLHRHEGYDSDAMYDVTRNIILGQNVMIPYPDKYWTAEVFLDGFQNGSTAYLFSVKK